MDRCPICSEPVPPAKRGQARLYCSPACRKRAELDARRRRTLETFEAAVGDVASKEEVLRLLSGAARVGSVLAAKTLLEELRRDGGEIVESSSVIDEISRRRKSSTIVS